jgi:hypothetical protein
MRPICMSHLENFSGDAEFRDSGFGVRPTMILLLKLKVSFFLAREAFLFPKTRCSILLLYCI